PFQWREDRENLFMEGLADFAQACTSFPMTIDGFAAFPPRVIYLDTPLTEPLSVLQKSLARTLRQSFGIHNDTHKNNGFVPHLTVAFRDLKKEAFLTAWEEVKDREVNLAWEQTTLSLLKHDGQRWQVLKDFSFSD
ncbi:MAG TPA: 2'-5' RNA ligase, partial [Cytophagales bacterium]|nr:2'-5' RNA ligase [Cytophagales bacterium]